MSLKNIFSDTAGNYQQVTAEVWDALIGGNSQSGTQMLNFYARGDPNEVTVFTLTVKYKMLGSLCFLNVFGTSWNVATQPDPLPAFVCNAMPATIAGIPIAGFPWVPYTETALTGNQYIPLGRLKMTCNVDLTQAQQNLDTQEAVLSVIQYAPDPYKLALTLSILGTQSVTDLTGQPVDAAQTETETVAIAFPAITDQNTSSFASTVGFDVTNFSLYSQTLVYDVNPDSIA